MPLTELINAYNIKHRLLKDQRSEMWNKQHEKGYVYNAIECLRTGWAPGDSYWYYEWHLIYPAHLNVNEVRHQWNHWSVDVLDT